MQKARGLRKLLSRRGNEKKEKLRKYFFRFYKAGIFSKVRSVRTVTKKYLERKNSAKIFQRKNNLENSFDKSEDNNENSNSNINKDIDDESFKNKKKNLNSTKTISTTEFKPEVDEDLSNFLKRSKTAMIVFDQKQKELEEKKIQKLQILFYKVDRIKMMIIRNVFKKYYLRSKLESISIIEGGTKKKKRRKSKKYNKGKNSEKKEDKKDDELIENKKEENQENIKNE